MSITVLELNPKYTIRMQGEAVEVGNKLRFVKNFPNSTIMKLGQSHSVNDFILKITQPTLPGSRAFPLKINYK